MVNTEYSRMVLGTLNEIEKPSASYTMCKNMIDDVFKKYHSGINKNKENGDNIPVIPISTPKYYKTINISGSGYAAAKFLR